MNDEQLDAFLSDALTPPDRTPDTSFAHRMEMLAIEQQRFARERRRILGRAAQDALCAASVLGGLAMLSHAESFAPFVTQSPGYIASPLALVAILWIFSHRWRMA